MLIKDGATVRSYGNSNHKKLAEMTSSINNMMSNNLSMARKWSIWPCFKETWKLESLLIVSNPVIGNEGQAKLMLMQPERLSEETSFLDDAIVRSHGNTNHERSAEMTDPDFCRQQ